MKHTPLNIKFVHHQQGYALREVILGLIVIAIVTVALVGSLTDAFKSANQFNAEDELRNIVASVAVYGRRNSNYNGVSVAVLHTRNYSLGGISTGANDNAYDLNTTIASADSHANALVTYTTPNQGTCQSLMEILTDTQTLISGSVACSTAGVLTFKVN